MMKRRPLLMPAIGPVCTLPAAAATAPAITDDDITFAVERAMVIDTGVPSNDIDVTTRDSVVTITGNEIDVRADRGVVTLSGTVDSFPEKSEAEDVALGTNGVVAVRNDLAVGYPALMHYDYGYGRYSAIRPDWSTRPFASDSELEEDIEYELFWSPFVDSIAVDGDVKNGVATLTWSVDNWRAFSAATQNAFAAGALGVVNERKVE